MSKYGIKLTVGPFRVSYPQVFEAKAMEAGQKPKFGLSMLFDKQDPQAMASIKAIREAILSEIKTTWEKAVPKPDGSGFTQPKLVNGKTVQVPTNFKHLCIRDGDIEKPDKDGYIGSYFINSKSEKRPGLIEQSTGGQILNPEEFYPGCYAKATITVKAYDHPAGGKGVSCYLGNIMKTAEGDQLGGGGTTAEEDFAGEIGGGVLG